MTFVDTSVWVESLRRRESPEARELERLLDADGVALAVPVRLEILSGAGAGERARLARLLSALPTFEPTHATWATMESWIAVAARKGERFGVADLLVAALAAENGGDVWSRDGDFARMAALGFARLHVPAPGDDRPEA